VAAEISTEEGRDDLLAAAPICDILVNNNGGPKPSYFADVDHDTWMQVIESNMVAPLMLTRRVLPGMKERRFGRILNITSAMVTMPLEDMVTSAGARAGLTAAMKAISFAAVRQGVTINNLLPMGFATQRQVDNAHREAARTGCTVEQAWRDQVKWIAAGRYGVAAELGATCAYVCSVHAAFMSGNNIHLDGGTYPGLV
ncbi:MAG: SDR family oxidoreductase, partial [Mycobacterium sp.]